MRQLNIGIIGCGKIAETHAQALMKCDDAALVWASDIDEQRVRQFAQNYNIPHYTTNHVEMLNSPEVDAVFVCTPSHLHKDIVISSAKAGKHVFCEKPIALSLKDSSEMIDVCSQLGVHLMIGFVRRKDSQWLKFKELVDNEVLGRPVIWRFIAGTEGPSSVWRFEAGSVVTEWAIHLFDFASFTFGNVKSVDSSVTSLKSGDKAIDTANVVVTYEHGDQLVLSLTWGLPEGVKSNIFIDAFGTKGVVLWEETVTQNYDVLPGQMSGKFIYRGFCGVENIIEYQKNDMYIDQAEYFIDCIRLNCAPIPGGCEGQLSLETACKVLETGRKL